MTERTGRCLCGAVSFKLSAEPLAVRVCWCKDCQHLAANGTVNMLVLNESLTVSGEVSSYVKTADSGSEVTRQFCPNCGSQLFAISSLRPQYKVVRVGNLDEPSSVQPSVNVWISRAPAWACVDSSLEQVDQQAAPPKSVTT